MTITDDTQSAAIISERITELAIQRFHSVKSRVSLGLEYTIHIDPIHKLNATEISHCFQLLDSNLGPYYRARQGKNWHSDKIEEMQEEGLIYVRFRPSAGNANDLIAFVSFMCVEDNDLMVLYIYELQIQDRYRGKKLGATVMSALESLAAEVNTTLDMGVQGIALTCFSNNYNALAFYDKMGFKKAPFSPQDKILRSGKFVKPDYYIFLKSLQS